VTAGAFSSWLYLIKRSKETTQRRKGREGKTESKEEGEYQWWRTGRTPGKGEG